MEKIELVKKTKNVDGPKEKGETLGSTPIVFRSKGPFETQPLSTWKRLARSKGKLRSLEGVGTKTG